MNRKTGVAVRLILICVFVIAFAASGFAAEIRRVPDYNLVEQGLMALILDVEGSENFRYTGKDSGMHVYRGTIKPESKLKFVIKATLGGSKTLPITGRSCTVRMQVIAKKGSEVIKTQNFKSDNKSSVFVNYTVPQNADTVEVSETFVLNNKSKNKDYNRTITERNKLILSSSKKGEAVAAGKNAGNGDKKSGSDNSKSDAKESEGTSSGMLAGAAAAVAAIGGGAFFFMKKRKVNPAANEEIARKEKLRQEAIRHQQEMQQQNLQRRQEEINEHNRMLEEQRLREQEQARQQEMQREQDDAPRFCHNCGTPLKPGSRFCENCGAKV